MTKGAKIDNKFNFIKSAIENLPIPELNEKGKAENLIYRDTKCKGLCVIVSYGGTKTFYLSKKIRGITQRIKLGKFPEISIEEARSLALQNLNIINSGKNPNEEKKKLNQEITFKDLFNQYIERHSSKNSKPKTISEYKRSFEVYLPSFHNKKISSISKHDIEKLHSKIGEKNGHYTANRTLSLIKAMYNKGIEWGFEGKNPAIYIKKFKEVKRDRYIKHDEMPRFFESLDQEQDSTLRSYFYIAILTGARKSNILSMRWEDIDFTLKEWRIPDTKNGDPHKVPLMDEAIELLNYLKKTQLENKIDTKYVFYSKLSASGHLEEPKSAWKRILERANIKNLRIHDIRRTMGSYQAIEGISLHLIAKGLGHKNTQTTEIYARVNIDPIRESFEKATGSIMKAGGKKNTSRDKEKKE